MKITPININMSPGPKENNQPRLAVNLAVGIWFALLASFLLFQYAYAEGLTNSIVAKSRPVATASRGDVPTSDLAYAFSKNPLSQNLVTAGLALMSTDLAPDKRAQWVAVIGKMGWRSTAAMQSLITEAVRTQNIKSITIVADALFRRRKLVDETVNLMLLLESEPSTWTGVYTRLKNQVPWRREYLQRADLIDQPAEIDGRIRTLRRLQSDGDRLTRLELAPSVGALVRAGKFQEAVEIWRNHSGDAPGIIHDTRFKIAAGAGSNTDVAFPFEWQFLSGTGFSAYPSEDGLNGATVAIQWDGRGLPVFMSQLTSAPPGSYQVSFKVDGDAQKFATKVGVRFRCGNEVIRTRNAVRPNSQIVAAETITPITCEFPWVDIFGQIQDRGAAVDLVFNRVMLDRMAN
jgi:hypothetical protein